MFARLHSYTVHERPGQPEEPILVREGFSALAFVFGGLWLLVHRAWLAGIVVLLLGGVLEWMQARAVLASPVPELLQLLLAFYVGLEGRELQREALERRGYGLGGVVLADNEERAFLRHFEQQAA